MTGVLSHAGGGWTVAVSTGGGEPSPPFERPTVVPEAERAPSIDTAVAMYLDSCRQRNHSPATMKNYRTLLVGGRGSTFFAERDVTMLSQLADGTAFRAFLLSLRDGDLTDSYQLTHYRTWHALLMFCVDQEWLTLGDRVFRVKPPRLAKKEPAVITELEESYLLGAAHSDRDRFIIRFLIRTGIRLAEAAALDVDDIFTAPSGCRLVRVEKGKGGKPRKLPLDTGGNRFGDEVVRYISEVRPASSDPALFLTLDKVSGWGGQSARRRGSPTRLTRRGIYIIFRRLREETGINVSPHKLRHTFATRAVAARVPTFAVQHALGHTTLEMTKRYVHYSTAHLEAAWAERKD